MSSGSGKQSEDRMTVVAQGRLHDFFEYSKVTTARMSPGFRSDFARILMDSKMDSVPGVTPTKRLRPSGIQPFLLSGAPPSYPPDFARISLGFCSDFARISPGFRSDFNLDFVPSLGFQPGFRQNSGFQPGFRSVVGVTRLPGRTPLLTRASPG